ncbi:hypothetical protein [Bartonella grahamii]|nr:hypothetical protein [Bartonella grahamii]
MDNLYFTTAPINAIQETSSLRLIRKPTPSHTFPAPNVATAVNT